ncbi:hypothetical protein DNFV4_03730 [Nitrospira tepida]|uniref:Uncharacterized protein n=1 Tax=Nitrospira tepida TaxID=2973512 RepID=A0AA86N264_9BACT|nr:hypothetical protein [Nitrospira tepida]CAI4033294.1 hypothetical protein DNFV4_03730 [Nitrospira tepida]
MAETCYSHGVKIILVPSRNKNGKWVCRFTIPGFHGTGIGGYSDHPPGEHETEGAAKTAAFEHAKRLLDSSR